MKHTLLLGLACLMLILGRSVYAGTITYVYSDPQGTPLAEADANGNITATFDYRPYGAPALGTSPNGPGYTGHVNDPDTGFVYMQARYYDPGMGRFLSADNVPPAPQNVWSFNRYVYALNNPIAHTDPDGNCPDACVVEGGVVVTAGAVYAVASALVFVGICEIACGKVKDGISGTAKEIWKKFHGQDSRSAPPPPLPEAGGRPHSIPDWKGGYTSYPSGKETEGKQYRPEGKPHGNIPRPNVKEWEPNVAPDGKEYPGKSKVRPPEPHEIPNEPPRQPPPEEGG